MLFGLCDGPKGVTEVLNPLIVIVWIQLRLVGLRMLSMGLHLANFGPNLSIIKLQMAISEDLPAGHTRYIALGCALQHLRTCTVS